jgi:hypothetical protein
MDRKDPPGTNPAGLQSRGEYEGRLRLASTPKLNEACWLLCHRRSITQLGYPPLAASLSPASVTHTRLHYATDVRT